MAKKGKVNRDEIYAEIAKKLNVPKEEVKKAVKHQFWYVHNVIKEGNYESVRLPYFGIFKVNPNRLDILRTGRNDKKD